MDWDPDFAQRSPMLEALQPVARSLAALRDWPSRDALQALVDERGITAASGRPLTLVTASGEPYEAQLYTHGELQVRDRSWHDLFNVLTWMVYPRTKRELNRRHIVAINGVRSTFSADGKCGPDPNYRGRVRDALTLFDESGVIMRSSDPSLLDDLRGFRWKRLFWDRREEVRQCMRFAVFGHALCEKALAPYIGMTAHALLIEGVREDDDEAVAEYLRDDTTFGSPRELAPLPVLGVPGWWRENERAEFYDNAEYFRPGRRVTAEPRPPERSRELPRR